MAEAKKTAPKKTTTRKAPEKKEPEKKVVSAEDILEAAEDHVAEGSHALLTDAWVSLRDAAVRVIEDAKRYDLLYETGRVTEGKEANKNLPRKDAQRVDETV